jgi:hypothetical protein
MLYIKYIPFHRLHSLFSYMYERGQIAELQKRTAWGDAEIEKKDTEIASLQHQLSAISWRTSLLESERHKGKVI